MPDDQGPFFWRCPDGDPEGPQAIGASLVSGVDCHRHLADARIAYVYRRKAKVGGGKVTLATASLVPDKWQVFAPFDFVIEVAWAQWQQLTPIQREALVDHELHHCGQDIDDDGFGTWVMVKHDVEEFSDVVIKYGRWKSDLKEFLDAAEGATTAPLGGVLEPLEADSDEHWWWQTPQPPEA